jgi:F-type H+-transporting ATPase subunit b
MITLDWTVLASGAVFLFTVWALNRLLFKPLLSVLDERRAKTSDLRDLAAREVDYQEALFEKYSEKIKQEKQAGYLLAETSRKEAMEERQKLMTEARSEGDVLCEKARSQIEQEVELVRQQLQRSAAEIAGAITAQVLEKTRNAGS